MRKLLRVASSEQLELHLYDFDGTLFKSPEPPDWWSNKKMGYWFNETISLSEPFIPQKPDASYWHGDVVRSAKNSIADSNTLAVMCTGRPDSNGSMRYRVAELLKGAGLDFDLVDLKRGTGSTAQYKAKLVLELLKKYPNISSVSVWEDTQENLDAIERVCRGLELEFYPHLVKGNPISTDGVSIEQYQSTMRMATMNRRTASEVLRNLEARVARLEGGRRTASQGVRYPKDWKPNPSVLRSRIMDGLTVEEKEFFDEVADSGWVKGYLSGHEYDWSPYLPRGLQASWERAGIIDWVDMGYNEGEREQYLLPTAYGCTVVAALADIYNSSK